MIRAPGWHLLLALLSLHEPVSAAWKGDRRRGTDPLPKAASPDVRTLWARVQYEFSYFPTNFWRTGEDENRYPIRMMVSARIWVPAAASSQRMNSSGQ
jgi:hypothetical protein